MSRPRIEVQQGLLEGIVCSNAEGKYIAFKGIPYAKPPLGGLRFKAPEPLSPWHGVRDASSHGPVCPQYNERMDRIDPGSEDCLYLNIYTRTITPKSPLPVMVWIHGGAFYTGSGNSDYYGPEFFMGHNIILVTVNYRLEVLGFLCLDNEDVPGNAGLKDQVLALSWIKKNIFSFGGDPNNVTIFGCSAGAASVSYHLISEMSRGLFHKAICQSGVCLNEWGYNIYPLQRAFQLGKLLGINTNNSKELLEYLRTVPALSLVNIKLPHLNNKHNDLADSILFGPVIERSDLKITKFLKESPIDLVKKGYLATVPLIVGYTTAEGIEIARNLRSMIGALAKTGVLVPRELKLKWNPEQIQDADDRIRKYYFGAKEITATMMKEAVNFFTDRLFSYNIHRFANYHSMHTSMPVYLYKFTAETERNYTKRQYNTDVGGVCHADELPYLFNITNLDIPLTDESRAIIKRFVQLWINFASTSNPTPTKQFPEWKSATGNPQSCYIIGDTLKCVEYENNNIIFWNEIYGEDILNLNDHGPFIDINRSVVAR